MGGAIIGILIFIASAIFGLFGLVFASTLGFALIASIMNAYYEKGGKDSI